MWAAFIIIVKALLWFDIVMIVVPYIWRHWTTPGKVSSMVDWLDKSPKLVDDMNAYQQEYGNFPLSQDSLRYLDAFSNAQSRCSFLLHRQRSLLKADWFAWLWSLDAHEFLREDLASAQTLKGRMDVGGSRNLFGGAHGTQFVQQEIATRIRERRRRLLQGPLPPPNR